MGDGSSYHDFNGANCIKHEQLQCGLHVILSNWDVEN